MLTDDAAVSEAIREVLAQLVDAWSTARGTAPLETDDKTGELVPAIRAERQPARPGEDTDVNGVLVPDGKGFRLKDDLDAIGRWRPMIKRRRLEEEAQARLARRQR